MADPKDKEYVIFKSTNDEHYFPTPAKEIEVKCHCGFKKKVLYVWSGWAFIVAAMAFLMGAITASVFH